MADKAQRGKLAAMLVETRSIAAASFPPGLFSEYAWDMMLLLFAAREEGRAIHDLDLYAATRTTPTVGQRWISYLADKGQVVIGVDGDPGLIALTPDAAASMENFLNFAIDRLVPTI